MLNNLEGSPMSLTIPGLLPCPVRRLQVSQGPQHRCEVADAVPRHLRPARFGALGQEGYERGSWPYY